MNDSAENHPDRFDEEIDPLKLQLDRDELLGEFEDSPAKGKALAFRWQRFLQFFSDSYQKLKPKHRDRRAAKATDASEATAESLEDALRERLALAGYPESEAEGDVGAPEMELEEETGQPTPAPLPSEEEAEQPAVPSSLLEEPPGAFAEDEDEISQFLNRVRGIADDEDKGTVQPAEEIWTSPLEFDTEEEEQSWRSPFTAEELDQPDETVPPGPAETSRGEEAAFITDPDFPNIFVADSATEAPSETSTGDEATDEEEGEAEQDRVISPDEYWISDQWRRELEGEDTDNTNEWVFNAPFEGDDSDLVSGTDIWQPFTPTDSDEAPALLPEEEGMEEPPADINEQDLQPLVWSDMEEEAAAASEQEPDWLTLRKELVGEPPPPVAADEQAIDLSAEPEAATPKTTLKEFVTSLSKAQSALLLSLLVIDLAIVALVSASYISAGIRYLRSQNQPTVSVVESVVYPIGLELTGGWFFPLEKGYLENGKWEPKTAEWLVGTEVRRVVAIPWTAQSEAVISTLQEGDTIRLVMSNKESKTYSVQSVEHVQRSQVDVLSDTRPSLVIILYQSLSDERWIVVCQP